MRVTDSTLIEAGYASWKAGDFEATMSCFADDVVFAIHLPPEVVPFAGLVRGKEDLARQLMIIFDDFDILDYKPSKIAAIGGSFHSQVQFTYRHKATGLVYEATARHIWRIEDGQIVLFEEFHDMERARAFFGLLATYARQTDKSPADQTGTGN